MLFQCWGEQKEDISTLSWRGNREKMTDVNFLFMDIPSQHHDGCLLNNKKWDWLPEARQVIDLHCCTPTPRCPALPFKYRHIAEEPQFS
jgi:hypothetical protein